MGRPFEVVRMTPHGAVELKGEIAPTFLVNGKRVKHYFGVDSDHDWEDLEINDELSKLCCVVMLNQALLGRQPMKSM